MIKNLVRNFARVDTPTEDFVRDINEERAELHQRKTQLEENYPKTPRGDRSKPLRLELHHHKDTNQIKCAVTLAGTALPAPRQAADEVVILAVRPRAAT